MQRRGDRVGPRNREWFKDIYRHPDQQGANIKTQHNMGHDIYSLGVCLIEIALWETFVRKDKNAYVHGALTGRAGLKDVLGQDDLKEMKQRLI